MADQKCRVCGAPIRVMIFKGSGACGVRHQRILQSEPTRLNGHAIDKPPIDLRRVSA